MTGQYDAEFERRLPGERRRGLHPVLLAGSAFALGLVSGLLLNGGIKGVRERARLGKWRHDYERTVTYDENLPDSLGRREPAPHPGQPRFGGTGAIGVSPAAADTAPPGDTTTGARDNL